MHPIPRLKMNGATHELTWYAFMAWTGANLLSPFVELQKPSTDCLCPMQKPSTDCHCVCRSPIQTFVVRNTSVTYILNVYLSLLSLVETFAVREHHMWRLLFDAANNLPTTCEPIKWEVFVFCFQVIPLFVHEVTAYISCGAFWNRKR